MSDLAQLYRKLTPAEDRDAALAAATPPVDPFQSVHRREVHVEPELRRTPLVPDEDLLLFLRDHNPYLADWEKDLLTIVHEQTQYFIPQIETKIMNEGWASFWHKRILESLDLPQALHLEFLVRHNQVCRPIPGQLNPYFLGLKLWEDIERRGNDPTPEERVSNPHGKSGTALLFETRTADRDVSFLRRWLTESMMRQLDIFRYEPTGDELVVSHVADQEGWRDVKETLLRSVGTATIPVIRVEDADHGHTRTLLLRHVHDGRDLQLDYAERTMAFVYRLWGRDVLLETLVNGKRSHLTYGEKGFAAKPVK